MFSPKPSFFILFSLLTFFATQTSCQMTGQDSQSQASTEEKMVRDQCLVVLTDGWDTAKGKLYKFVKKGDWSKWTRDGEVIDVLIGKKGLGWGIGVADFTSYEGPVKKEGDLKSPAGVFTLSNAFGYAKEAKASQWPYYPVIPSTMCIEDIQSEHYNRIIDEDSVKSDWKGTDHMLRKDDLYEWGVFVDHNPNQRAGNGSCIFLHVWRPGGSGTAGCTSMDKGEMLNLIQWLDPSSKVQLVQCPRSVYAKLKNAYGLPSIYD